MISEGAYDQIVIKLRKFDVHSGWAGIPHRDYYCFAVEFFHFSFQSYYLCNELFIVRRCKETKGLCYLLQHICR